MKNYYLSVLFLLNIFISCKAQPGTNSNEQTKVLQQIAEPIISSSKSKNNIPNYLDLKGYFNQIPIFQDYEGRNRTLYALKDSMTTFKTIQKELDLMLIHNDLEVYTRLISEKESQLIIYQNNDIAKFPINDEVFKVIVNESGTIIYVKGLYTSTTWKIDVSKKEIKEFEISGTIIKALENTIYYYRYETENSPICNLYKKAYNNSEEKTVLKEIYSDELFIDEIQNLIYAFPKANIQTDYYMIYDLENGTPLCNSNFVMFGVSFYSYEKKSLGLLQMYKNRVLYIKRENQ